MCEDHETDCGYALRALDIDNPDYTFYEALKDGRSFFEEFQREVRQAADRTSLSAIYNLMTRLRKNTRLPYKLFHHIGPNHKGDREDIYEFKKNNLRVYVALLPDDVIVLLGGFKKNQDADIGRVFRQFNQMNIDRNGQD